MKLRTLGTVALVVMALTSPVNAASADVADVAPEVSYALEAQPGGVATDYWHAEWPALGMTLTVANAQARAIGSCSSGRVCAFSGYGATGSYLSWSTCGSHSTAALSGSVRSIANARSSGTLSARNGTTVVAKAGAGATTNVYATVTNVYC